MNLLANSTGGTLASAVASRLSFATVGVKAGIDLLAQGYATLSNHNTAVLSTESIDAFASESAALKMEDAPLRYSLSFSDIKPLSLELASISAGESSAVSAVAAGSKADAPIRNGSTPDKSITVGSKATLDGEGSAISRAMRLDTSEASSDDIDNAEIEGDAKGDRVFESAERFAHIHGIDPNLKFKSDEIGAQSFISSESTARRPKGKAQGVSTKSVQTESEGPKFKAASTEAGAEASASTSHVDVARVASEPQAMSIPLTRELGSEIFVGARTKARRPDRTETREAVRRHLIAHLSPASSAIIAQQGVSLDSRSTAISTFQASSGPIGTTNISLTVTPRGRDHSAEIHFSESNGKIEFAGIERGRSMGATQPLPIPLPIPTFSPAGILRDGMIEPRQGLPGRAPHDGSDRGESEAELEQRLATLVLDQLRQGPDSSSAANLLMQLNNYLVNNGLAAKGQAVTPAAWIRMVRRALGLLIRSVPLFDEKGLRTIEAIRHDVAATAGMDVATLRAWDGAFETDLVTEQLFRISEISDDSVEAEITERLETGLKKLVPVMAKSAASQDFIEPAIGYVGEINLQWGIAVIGAMEGIELKVRAVMDFLSSVYRKNPKAACKGIALIVKHSTISERNLAEALLFDRWSEAEVRSLIASMMRSEMWEIMSQRAMRKHFSDDPNINGFLNEAIFNANYTKAIEELNRIDVTQVSDEAFWDAVERTGVEETLMDTVIARMAQFN